MLVVDQCRTLACRRSNRKAAAAGLLESVDDIKYAQRIARKCATPLQVDGIPGWRTRRWVRMFQGAFMLGRFAERPLEVTGVVDADTIEALRICEANGYKASPNFRFSEFRTRLGDPNYVQTKVTTGNAGVKVSRQLLIVLEAIRAAIGRAITVRSGYRDDWWNIAVRGAKFSQHLRGFACDIDAVLGVTREIAVAAGATGLGRLGSNGIVTHVDVRNGLFGRVVQWFYR